jgi:type IV secretion system protein VirD4
MALERSFAGRLLSGYRLASSVFNDLRAAAQIEAEAQARASAQHVLSQAIAHPQATGVLGNARASTREDVERAGLYDSAGLFLGRVHGLYAFYNGPGHLLTYGRVRSGKGRDVILPNLAHAAGRSLVVADVKNGENAYASADYRRTQGPVVFLNPLGLHGMPSTRFNPLQRVIAAAQAQRNVWRAAREVMDAVIPARFNDENEWAREGARRFLSLLACWYAITAPERCTLGMLWNAVNQDPMDLMKGLIKSMVDDGQHPALGRRAAYFRSLYKDAPKQWAAYADELGRAVEAFEPGSDLERATAATDLDLAALKTRPHTVYVMLDGTELESCGAWVSLVINEVIKTTAATPGPVPVVFLLDEVTQLPFVPEVMKCLRMYPGKKLQLWFFAQGRQALRDRYGAANAADIEDLVDVMQTWGIEDPSLLRDLEMRSGKTSVAVRSVSFNGSAVQSGGFGISEQVRPLYHAHELALLRPDQQVLRCPNAPLFVGERVPWFAVADWTDRLRDVRPIESTPRITTPTTTATAATGA